MLISGLIDIAIDTFSGYNPAVPPQDLPSGASPNCQDVAFPQSAVCQRGGLRNLGYAGVPPAAKINGLKSFLTSTLQKLLMVYDSLGNLYNENPQGTLNLISQRPYSNLLYQSQTLFGREYIALGNAAGGADFPLQYDGTFLDRVSQCGPGGGVTVADDTNPTDNIALQQYSSTIGAISQVGNTVTVIPVTQTVPGSAGLVSINIMAAGDIINISSTTNYNGTYNILGVIPVGAGLYGIQYFSFASAPAPESSGEVDTGLTWVEASYDYPYEITNQSITIAGATPTGYIGTWPIRFSDSGTSSAWVAVNTFGLINASGSDAGQSPQVGVISPGIHQVAVAFITRQGAITKPSPFVTWTAAGSLQANVFVPAGPSNVVARLILATPVILPPATTGNFYSIETASLYAAAMLIQGNGNGVGSNVQINFSDTDLITGFNGQYLFSQVELGSCDTFTGYSQRTAWLGEANKIQNFLNLEFNGGWNLAGGGSDDIPLGWTQDSTYGAGGTRAFDGGIWLDGYQITCTGLDSPLGMITQTAYQDYLGVAILSASTQYSVRTRAKVLIPATAGNLVVDIFSPASGGVVASVTLPLNQFKTKYSEIDFQFSLPTPFVVQSDTLLRLYVSGNSPFGQVVTIDSIEPFPTSAPINLSTAYLSYAFNPEGFSGTTGQIQVRPGDGQGLQGSFTLRGTYYLLKDHYWASATDDGVNEPASWPVTEISSTIGTCSGNAIDTTEEWAVAVERSGMYLFWGGDPVKITPEIQEDASKSGKIVWNSINWAASYTIWVRIDKVNKHILCGVPVNGATSPNIIFVLDYKWLDNAQDIASSPSVTYSQFTGKSLCHGRGRRWTYWNIAANCMTFAERSDGTAQPFFGNGVGNGKVYQQYDCNIQSSDDGVEVNGIYQTAYIPNAMDEQALQLSAHRKKLGMMKWRAIGAGSLFISIYTGNRITTLRSYTLSTVPAADSERSMSISAERFSFEFQTNNLGNWWQLEKLIACMKKDASILVRGGNQ